MASSFSKLNEIQREKKKDEESPTTGKKRSRKERDNERQEDDERRERDEIRRLIRKENERERRREAAGMNKTKNERDADRDISEKIALGQAQPTVKDVMYDQRLFNQSAGLGTGFGDEEDYNLYDKPLFADRTASSIYKNVRRETGQGNLADQLSDDGNEKGDKSEVKDVLRQQPDRGFAGQSGGPDREISKKSTRAKPVEFERHQLEEDQAFGNAGLQSQTKRARKE